MRAATRSHRLRFVHLFAVTTASLTLPTSAADSLASWVGAGQAHLTLNPRYEYGKIDGLRASHAATLKTLLGYTTADWNGVSALVEFTDTRALDRHGYNAAGVHGPSDRTPIADPETTELNQLVLTYAGESGSGKLGRQRFVLDNGRFIGNVGWRQNEQTFDAVTASFTPIDKLTVSGGYLHRINRIFAETADWDAASYLLHARYALDPRATFTTYYYHQSFDGAAPTTDTLGGYVAGAVPVNETFALTYRLEAAYQEYTHAPIRAGYFHGVLGTTWAGVDVQVGYEVLGSDGGNGQFLTPLATGHAFNGFADTYLDNGGPGGIRDLYFSVAGNAGPLRLTAIYHSFRSDHGNAGDGREIDFVVTYPLTDALRLLAKAAFYEGDIRPDRERFILQLTAAF